MATTDNLEGKRFGRWLVLKRTENRGWDAYYLCRCDCGEENIVRAFNLLSGDSKSCGCYATEQRRKSVYEHHLTHGLSHTKEHRAWGSMKTRCYDKNAPIYKSYGDRGIKVCDRWLNSFEAFLEDMGMAPNSKLSIDRVDNDGNYEPSNCRWATAVEQGRNKKNNRYLTFQGRTLTLSEWAEITGLRADTIGKRLDDFGWTVEKALTKPAKSYRKKIFYKGQLKTLRELASELCMPYSTLVSRLNRGQPMINAMGSPSN